MPIQVTCPGCKKRFKVSEKYAGQKGPCPQCKAVIRIPDTAEVVIHAPEAHGPVGVSGRPVLEPITREETRLSTVTMVAIGVAILTVLIVAVVLRSPDRQIAAPILAFGALLLGPLLARSSYAFLRDDEYEPYRGRSLWVRSLICGGVFALMWAGYWGIKIYLFQGDSLEIFQLAFIVPVMVAGGALAAMACFDLDFLMGSVCYGSYLLATVVLRLIMNLGAF